MALFILCIGEGHYRRAAGVMSAYRKHGAQITARPGHGAAAHPFNRILLWARVDAHFRHRWRQRIQGVVRTHWERLVRQTDRGARFRYLLHLALRQPAWCLRNPRFPGLGRTACHARLMHQMVGVCRNGQGLIFAAPFRKATC
jgi:hypothetical protein